MAVSPPSAPKLRALLSVTNQNQLEVSSEFEHQNFLTITSFAAVASPPNALNWTTVPTTDGKSITTAWGVVIVSPEKDGATFYAIANFLIKNISLSKSSSGQIFDFYTDFMSIEKLWCNLYFFALNNLIHQNIKN